VSGYVATRLPVWHHHHHHHPHRLRELLTSAASVAEVREAPEVAHADGEAESRHGEVKTAAPDSTFLRRGGGRGRLVHGRRRHCPRTDSH